jgi:hypothetical protein
MILERKSYRCNGSGEAKREEKEEREEMCWVCHEIEIWIKCSDE